MGIIDVRFMNELIIVSTSKPKVAMSSDFYERTILTFYMQYEIELDVSLNLIYSFPMIASNISGNPYITKLKNLITSMHFYSNHGTRDKQ